ncbi:MAG TPA: DUF3105 domain-containing protein [Polyangiaceae bacterium]|nr:DUF3105 domain-containing protein [Polyangiaceae bacterium]
MKRRSARAFSAALFGLTGPFLLAHCGNAGSGVAEQAGAAGAAAESGATNGGNANGAAANGGNANGGNANGGAMEGGSAGSSEAGLGGTSAAGTAGADAGEGGSAEGLAGSGACAAELLTFSNPSAQHVSVCSVISYPMNPPVYGDHYPVWAAYKSYTFPVPLGFLVHDLEHGAVELLYNCPQGCADEVALAQTFLDALPMDPRCEPEVKHQTILAPDPTLPSRWAATAWGHSLTTDCFDRAAFQSFYDANIGHGPEDTCTDGADLASDTCL